MTAEQARSIRSAPGGFHAPGTHARRFAIASLMFGAIVFLQGSIALTGWALGNEGLKGGAYSLGITIKANTALALVLCGAALMLLAPERRGAVRTWIGRICASLASAIGLATLSQHLFGWDLKIDQMLFPEAPGLAATSSPNRMGPPAAICFPLIGFSLLFLDGWRIPKRGLRCHPSRCPRPPAAPARWTPRGTSVPMPAVAIAAGWGWGTCAPTAIPVAAHGDHSSVPRARAISRSITARSSMASKGLWS